MTFRKILTIISVLVLMVVAASRIHTGGEPLYTIESEIVLPAPVEQCWAVLTDFARYPEWNPYATRVEGEFRAGEKLSFTIVDGNFEAPLDLESTLETIVPNEHFNWVGTLLMRGVHDTRHGFRLRDEGDGTTHLLHYEEFRGFLARILPDRAVRVGKTRESFDRMNEALRRRLSKPVEAPRSRG